MNHSAQTDLSAWIWLTVLLFMLPVSPSAAQKAPSALDRIGSFIEKEDVVNLLAWASDPVDIAVFGASKPYSLSQGRYVLRRFFNSIEVISFSITEYTVSEESLFVEGLIHVPASQTPVRTYLRLKRQGKEWVIRELLFERKSK